MDQVSSCNLADRLSAFHCLKAWERISRVEYPPWHMAKLELNQCAAVKAKRCRFIAVSYTCHFLRFYNCIDVWNNRPSADQTACHWYFAPVFVVKVYLNVRVNHRCSGLPPS